MAILFSPTRQDVERYRSLRSLSMNLSHRIVQTIPNRAYDEVGSALGILRNGVLVFDSEDMTSVMMDCCLYDWFENGKNLVQRYAETHPSKPGTDESCLLNAYLQAKYRILLVQSAVPGAGLHCQDVLNGGELFVMDISLSQSLKSGSVALATRTIPLGEYSMTGGAGLPITSSSATREALRRIESGRDKSLESPGAMALLLVRACLAAGAAGHVAYETPAPKSKKPLRLPRWPGSKRRH